MSQSETIRAWKDIDYRNSLSIEDLAKLPAHPAGAVELNSDDLSGNAAAAGSLQFSVCICTTNILCPF